MHTYAGARQWARRLVSLASHTLGTRNKILYHFFLPFLKEGLSVPGFGAPGFAAPDLGVLGLAAPDLGVPDLRVPFLPL